MKLVSFPYRWMPRTFFTNISHIYWDFKNGILNLFTFFEAVWWFRSWDWTGLVELIEVSAREMRFAQEHGIHTNSDRYAKQLKIVEALCKRLRADEYFENAGYQQEHWNSLPEHRCSQIAKHSVYMAAQDAAYLGRMLRFVQCWWE